MRGTMPQQAITSSWRPTRNTRQRQLRTPSCLMCFRLRVRTTCDAAEYGDEAASFHSVRVLRHILPPCPRSARSSRCAPLGTWTSWNPPIASFHAAHFPRSPALEGDRATPLDYITISSVLVRTDAISTQG